MLDACFVPSFKSKMTIMYRPKNGLKRRIWAMDGGKIFVIDHMLMLTCRKQVYNGYSFLSVILKKKFNRA